MLEITKKEIDAIPENQETTSYLKDHNQKEAYVALREAGADLSGVILRVAEIVKDYNDQYPETPLTFTSAIALDVGLNYKITDEDNTALHIGFITLEGESHIGDDESIMASKNYLTTQRKKRLGLNGKESKKSS